MCEKTKKRHAISSVLDSYLSRNTTGIQHTSSLAPLMSVKVHFVAPSAQLDSSRVCGWGLRSNSVIQPSE